MEILKRKILIESSIDRKENSPTWGTITATTFYLNIFISQTIDNMGIFTDMSYIPKTGTTSIPPDYSILINKLSASGYRFPFMSGIEPIIISSSTENKTLRVVDKNETNYYKYLKLKISGYTDSKLEDVRSYDASIPFRMGFDIERNNYINYRNQSISGVSRVVSIGEPKNYVFDTINDPNLGTINQTIGLRFLDYTGKTRTVNISGIDQKIPITQIDYIGEGWNNTNILLSASTKEEYLFGVIFKPEIENQVFIDRGITSVMDKHLRLSEINDLRGLVNYGNGFYKINKQ